MHALILTTRLRSIGLVAAAALLWSAPLPVAAQSELTSRELTALPARGANRAAQRDLLSVFEPVTKYERGMFLRVRGVSMATRPYGTEFQGVCRKDVLTLWYTPARSEAVGGANPDNEPGGHVQDVALEPYGVDALALFHIDHLPAGKAVALSQTPAWQPACDAHQFSKETSWFAAKDNRQAVQAANMFRMAEDRVRAGTLAPKPCSNVGKRSCVQAILAVDDLAKLSEVESCDAPPDHSCVRLNLNEDTELTIIAHLDPNDENDVAPDAIVSIDVSNYIVVT